MLFLTIQGISANALTINDKVTILAFYSWTKWISQLWVRK